MLLFLSQVPATELKEPRGIAIDWVSQNIYWTDSKAGKLQMATLKGTSPVQNVVTLINTNLDHPYALAIDPEAR